MIYRTVREWERIDYGTDKTEIPEAQANRIATVARTSRFSGRGEEGVLEHGRKGLRARGIVGVIAAPGCQLEILPKIEGSGEGDVKNTTLRKRLIHMLAVAYDLPIDDGDMTRLDWQNDTILELLIRLFCKKLTEAVRLGMPRQYIEHADDLPAMRGRLDINRQFSLLAASPQKLACQFDDFSPDTALNQVMRATVTKLARLTTASQNQRFLRELSFAYAEVADIPTTTAYNLCNRIMLDRTNQRWKNLLALARLFLSARHQQTRSGAIDGYSMLFEMSALFEKYVAKILTHTLAGTEFRVTTQGGQKYCLYEEDTGRFKTRPDIIIRQGEQSVLIIDTKWKRIKPRIEDPKQGVSQADVYQLMAYGRLYDCPNVMLLYPHHAELLSEPIPQRYSIAERDAEESLIVATLNLSGARDEHKEALWKIINEYLLNLSAVQNQNIKENTSAFSH